jgi:ferric-dicitrate binding protein FerR (iron transport regulator)
MTRPCNRLWEIDQYREGRLSVHGANSFRRHLRACADCRGQTERDEALRKLARQLPDRGPADLALRRLKSRVLRDTALGLPARPALGRRWRVAVSIWALGVAAMLLVASRLAPRASVASSALGTTVTRPAPEVPLGPVSQALAGSVVAASGARWSQTRKGDFERVQLDEGAIRVHVRSQASGERFLVMTPDGEIEVRGTTFDASVEHGATKYVHVDEGVVELRLRDRGVTLLFANETYNAPAMAAVSGVSPRPQRVPVPPPTPRVPPAATHPEDDDIAYTAAIDLLHQGRFDQAASAFHALALAAPGTPQAEDASFLEAVAIARAGRTDAAALAAEHYLASFPDSFHRKEATILVIRAASERGDCGKARAMIASWKNDSLEPNLRSALGPCGGGLR